MTPTSDAARRLRVLQVHNRYQQRGGEDAVVEAEAALLSAAGHEVRCYERHNDEVGQLDRLTLARQTLWSPRTLADLRPLLAAFRPDVMHVHNTFALVSPSVYTAAREAGVPVVQTLHNYRLVCPQALLLREGRVCEDCIGHVPWRAVRHRCYRGSAAQSAALAATVQWHRWRGTWRDEVTLYVALDESSRARFVAGGLPAAKIRIKPHSVDVPALPPPTRRSGCLFVGRLALEKGLPLLLAPGVLPPGLPLTVIGDGPLAPALAGAAQVRHLGWQPREAVLQAMQTARALVVPSVWPEMFGLVVIEALAAGLPVIASRIGALPSLVEHGRTGLLFEPGDATSLAAQLRWAAEHPAELAQMGAQARQCYEARYTPAANLLALQALYDEARAAAPQALSN